MTVRLPAWLQGGSYSAETDRSVATGLLVPATALSARGGVRHYNGNDFKVLATAPATLQISVNPGMAWVPGVFTTTQGTYAVVNDAVVTLPISAANSTNPRIDLVIVEVLDQVYSGVTDLAQVRVVTGTPAATPVAPAVAGSYILLAQVFVAANATSISSTAITDMRAFAAALGSPTPVVSSSARLTLTGVPAGMSVYEIDTTRIYQWDGVQWNYQWGGAAPTVSITPASGWFNWSANNGQNYAFLRGTKTNTFVSVTGVLGNSSNLSTGKTMFNLPSGWWPEKDLVRGCFVDSNNDRIRIDVKTDGRVIADQFESVFVPSNTAWFIDLYFNARNNTIG